MPGVRSHFAAAVAALSSVLFFFSPTLAGPRDTRSYNNVDSLGLTGNAANQSRSFTLSGGYAIRRIDLSGNLLTQIAGVKPLEARIKITPPAGMGAAIFTNISSSTLAGVVGDNDLGLMSIDVPATWIATGAFTVEFHQSVDHGGGADAQWTIVNITFNDAPPPPIAFNNEQNLGEIVTNFSKAFNLGSGQVEWFRFSVPQAAGAIGYLYGFDAHTVGSTLTDPVIALYNDRGQLVVINDDINGSFNRQSLLSFGMGYRPPSSPVTGATIGHSGSLDAGTYYLAVVGFAAANQFGPDFGVTSASTLTGQVKLNFYTGLPAPFGASCGADFNHSGGIEVQDIFDFLSAWFAACP